MPSYQVKQSSTAYPLVFLMIDSSDHLAAKTGLSPTVTIRKVGGSFATPTGSVTEIANGWYQVAGNATDSATLGPLLLHATATGADPTDMLYEVIAHDVQDAVHLGLSSLPNVASGSAGAIPTTGTGSNQISVSSGLVTLAGVTHTGAVIPTTTTVTNQLTAAAIATGVWQDTTSGDFTVASSAGKSIFTGVAPGAAGGHFIAGTNAATTVTTAFTSTFTGNLTGSVNSVTTGVTLAASQHVIVDSGTVTTLTNLPAVTTDWLSSAGVSAAAVTKIQSGLATPTNITAASGVALAASQHVIVDSGTVTTLTNLPSIPANWITSTGITAAALNGKGDWNTTTPPSVASIATGVWQDATAGDFTVASSAGKSIFTGVAPGAAGGHFIAGTNAATTVTTAFTSTFTGNLTGSVGSVTGAVGSVTGAVGSVTGAVGSVTTGVALAASQHVIVDSGTVTTLTNLPAVTTDWLTAAGVKADAVTKIQSGLATPTNITAGTITTCTNLTNAPTAGDLTATMKTSVTTAATAATPTAAAVTGAVGSVTAGVTLASPDSAVLQSGTAQAGSAGTITLVSGASATDSLYVGCRVRITSGSGAGQSRTITGYVGSTKVATVDWNWTTNPSSSSVYAVVDGDSPALNSSLQVAASSVQGNLTGSVGSVTGAVGSVTGAVGSVTGAVGSVTGAVGSVTAGVTLAASQHVIVDSGTVTTLTNLPSIPANWITATGITAAALNGKGDWNTTTPPTVAAIATGVWQDTTSGDFATASSIGKSLFTGVAPGAANGLFIAGTNAATTVTTAFTSTFTGNLTGSVGSVTGAVGSVTGAVVLPSIPANWITSTGITAAALNGKGDWNTTTPPTAATIAGATWDVVLSGHLTAGTAGAGLNAAGSAGDPWSVALPGSYGAGTAGYVIGHNIDALISTRSTYAGGAVASVTGAVGSVTGAVGSVTAGVTLAASQHVIVDSGTVTTLTNLPSIPANWITSTGITAAALNGKGDWNTTTPPTVAAIATGIWQDATAGDFTIASSIGKSLFTGVAPGAAGGLFIAGTNAATTVTTAFTSAFTGNLTGSVGSVTGAVGSVTGAVGSVTGAVGSVTAGVTLASPDSAVLQSGTAQAGNAGTITLASGASATDSLYVGCRVRITSGSGAGQSRTITGYVGSTKVATVDWNWTTNPSSSSVYAVVDGDSPALNSSLQVAASSVQGNVTGSVGSVTAAVTLPSIPANWITAAGITAAALNGKGDWSTYAGGDTSGTTTLLTRLTSTRAGLLDNLDAAISTRSTYAGGAVASVTGAVGSVTGAVGSVTGAVGSVTGAVVLPSIPANWITAAGINAAALNGKGDWNTTTPPTVAAIATGVWQDTTSGDFTVASSVGKSIFTGVAPGAVGGLFIAGTNAATTVTTAFTSTFTGNLTGSVGSVTGAVGSVTGAVGSVTGAVVLPSIPANWITAAGINAAALNGKGDWSTYAGGDTSGTTTLLSRLTSTRAGLLDNLDAAVSTRSTYAGGAVASVTGAVGSVTGAVVLPSIPTNWITATGINASALNGKGDWNTTTPPTAAAISTAVWQDLLASSDFSTASSVGSLLKTAIPNAVAGAAGGLFIAGTNAATTVTTAFTSTFTGNLTGSVGSVTGAVGSVTGAVGSVTGAVGSVTAGVTLAASQHVIVDSGTVTTLTNLPAVTANWLTGTGTDATAVTKIQSGLATPTNITAGTITTVTNLTNAPTAGDLTATMKTSVTTAATAATPTAAAVTGAVGSVTGGVGGNVTGSVGSVVSATIKKNTALANFEFMVTDSTNHVPATGKTVTCTRSIDGSSFAAGTLANVAEVAFGMYRVDFGAGDLNGAVITLRATAAACDDTFITVTTTP